MRVRDILLHFLFLLSGAGFSYAQDSIHPSKMILSIHGFDSPEKPAHSTIKYFRHSFDSITVRRNSELLEKRMASLGFSEFALDSFKLKKPNLSLWFHCGNYYYLDQISIDGLRKQEMEELGFIKMQKNKWPLDRAAIEIKLGSYLRQYQNKGYPFAKFDSLGLSFIPITHDTFATEISYRFNEGDFISIDTVIFEGKKKERDRFVRTLIGIQHGDAYDQSAIDGIQAALDNSIYYKNKGKPRVEFGEKTATITVPLEQKRTGKFDLLIGILPPRQGTTEVQWSGLADFQFVSPFFHSGESFRFRFDKLPGTSQKMHVEYAQPYIFGSPLAAQGEFYLQKQDTSFLNRTFKLTGKYSFTHFLSFRAWYRGKTSILISTQAYENDSTHVPPVLDGKDKLYGVGFVFDNLDYRLSPTKGMYVKADFGLGSKRIVQNPKLAEGIYSTLDLQQPKKEADFEIQLYKLLFKRWVFCLANKTWWLKQEQYFQNDLLQVGGSRSIRGFNENEFYTDFYTFSTIEARFLLERSSYIFTFVDYAYLHNQLAPDKVIHPFGTGLGMAYETKAGIVTLTYAIGKSENLSFQPSRGRIHIGLINQF